MAEEKPKKAPRSKLAPLTSEAAETYVATQRLMDGGISLAGTDRWAWANNVLSEGFKINLINFGYMSNPEIPENGVEVIIPEDVRAEARYITYRIGLPRRALK